MTAAEQTVCRAARLWKPPEELTLSQWADRYRRTSREASAEVGNWVTRPYQREPFDAFTDPRVRRVVVMSSVQMLKTELQLCVIGYCIHNQPAPILLVLPRDDDCDTFSKLRLAPMLRDTPCLHGRVADAKSRFSGNTISQKLFPGGHLRIVAGGSPANLAALPIKILLCDEIDKFPPSAGAEGDPIALAEGRTAEFPDAKVVLTCSPTTAGYSAIERAYNESDRREYEVPCPHCGEFQVLKFRSQVVWDDTLPSRKKQADSARYLCEHCKQSWNDAQRWKAIHKGRYRATEPFSGIAGFRISQLCSLKKRLSQIVLHYLRAKDDGIESLKVFFNTVLAETWVDRGEAPDHEKLLERREQYSTGIVPPGALFLTAGADVQRDRIEVEIVGWGRGRESWSVDYRVLEGKTSEPAVWAELEKVARETFPLASGGAELPIARFFIDSGDGTTTNDVYNWCRQQPASQVCAIKGDGRGDLPVSERRPVDVTIGGKRLRRGLHIRHVNSSFFKSEFYADLRKRKPTAEELAQGWVYPPGYCHFPEGQHYGDEHFKQIVAEQLIATVNRKTRRVRMEWQQLRPRNEALDCRVYARAAAWDFGLDRFQEKHWQILSDKLLRESKGPRPPQSQETAAVPNPTKETPPPRPRESWILPRRSESWFAR